MELSLLTSRFSNRVFLIIWMGLMQSKRFLTVGRGRQQKRSQCCGVKRMPFLALSVRKGTTSQAMQAASRSQTRQGDGYSPGVSGKEGYPTNTSISVWGDLCQTPNLQNLTIVNSHCFKLLSSWQHRTHPLSSL